jgi:hypothetical protein
VTSSNKSYRNIYIVASRSYWNDEATKCDPEQDLVLTFDFGLKHEIEGLGGDAFYIDSLCSPDEMQKNNFLAAEFFKKWHYDKAGNDIFTAQGVSFGFAFRIEIWSEYLYYVRLRANLELLRKINYHAIIVGEGNCFIGDILKEMGLPFVSLDKKIASGQAIYFFDIHKYMFDALHGKSIKDFSRKTLVATLSIIRFYIDRIFKIKPNIKTVYAQIYHPTKKIIECLQNRSNIRLITSSLSGGKGLKKYFVQRLIPLRSRNGKFINKAELLLDNFKKNRCAKLILSDGTDATAGSFKIIEHQIQTRVPEALRILSSVIDYIEKHPIHLEIMIANLGLLQTIVDCVLKRNRVPSYLIINGLMPAKFGDEAKYAMHINSYGPGTKKNYFNDGEKVVCLGDPRMDDYINNLKNNTKIINRLKPTIAIGTSGFNNIDLTSYVAVEFDFIFDVLTAFDELKNEGQSFSIVLKVRPNGVLDQYKSFITEYFGNLEIEVLQKVPISDVLQKSDLYISIYSQTLFEASCMGIPAIYYKKDKEYLDPPFDRKSELVTVDTVNALKQAFLDFKKGDARFDAFLEKTVMEKYIGPLDGKNLERNVSFVYELLDLNTSTVSNK